MIPSLVLFMRSFDLEVRQVEVQVLLVHVLLASNHAVQEVGFVS